MGHLLKNVQIHYFIFNKRPIYTHAGASAKFSTNSHEKDYSVCCNFRTIYGSYEYSLNMVTLQRSSMKYVTLHAALMVGISL
jgi:hypothetical protein